VSLPDCPYRVGDEPHREVQCSVCGCGIQTPVCMASITDTPYHSKVSCMSVLTAELCPEGWR